MYCLQVLQLSNPTNKDLESPACKEIKRKHLTGFKAWLQELKLEYWNFKGREAGNTGCQESLDLEVNGK